MNNKHTTPLWLILSLEAEFGKFDLDPCASEDKDKWFALDNWNTKVNGVDGLRHNWSSDIIYVNCPYSQGNIPKWIRKSHDELQNGNCKIVVMLLPADTSTRWFHDYFCTENTNGHGLRYWTLNSNVEVRLLNRLNFSSEKNNAKFPSMLVILRKTE